MTDREANVVKFLLNHRDSNMNINMIAKGMKADYKNTYCIVRKLQKKGTLKLQESGKSMVATLSDKPSPILFEAEYERRKDILKDMDIRTLLDYYGRNMESGFHVMLLFGSYATGKRTKGSDIDLLFIVPDECEARMEKNILSIASMMPLKLHINIFKEKDFLAMKNSKEQTVGSEAIRNNIILHGIEHYYELMK